MLTVGECGETELIRRLQGLLYEPADGEPSGVVLGPGDDAAVLKVNPSSLLVSSCDMLIEGRHFDLAYTTPRDLGYKALAVNISDVAAMGGNPRWAMVSLALSPETPLQFWEEFYRGMISLAREAGVALVGGDTTSSSITIVDVSIMGEADGEELCYRSSASPGDLLAVTGVLGSSAAGLYWLQNSPSPELPERKEIEPLLCSHLRPRPRYLEASQLRRVPVKAMIDLSDGLAAGVSGICSASRVGARVELSRLPCLEETGLLARSTGKSLEEWMLYGGEDYELLFTVAPEVNVSYLQDTVAGKTGAQVSIIGEIVDADRGAVLVTGDGEESPLQPERSYNHFK